MDIVYCLFCFLSNSSKKCLGVFEIMLIIFLAVLHSNWCMEVIYVFPIWLTINKVAMLFSCSIQLRSVNALSTNLKPQCIRFNIVWD